MIKVAVTQRVDLIESCNERRDALDQEWISFISKCELLPVLIPNCSGTAMEIVSQFKPESILLTGGNSLVDYGGDAPERDSVERFLVDYAIENNLPVLGVCRGMQFIQNYFGVKLHKVAGHVSPDQLVFANGKKIRVNSYHDFGTVESVEELRVWAKSDDGVIKAINHRTLPIVGIMWHPERIDGHRQADIDLFRAFFSTGVFPDESNNFSRR